MATRQKRQIVYLTLIFSVIINIKSLSSNGLPVTNEDPLKTNVDKELLVSELKEKIPELMDKALIPGMSFALIRNGKIEWLHEFGVKNADTGEPVKVDTIFEAASLGKPVFTYGVMKLVEEGKLDLDIPLLDIVSREYLEGVNPAYKTNDERFTKITARQVLTHSTGFPNWFYNNEFSINFEPGEKFSYSGEAFSLLAEVVVKITGKSFVDFTQEYIFAPLSMKDSCYVWRADFESRFASSHDTMGNVTPRGKSSDPLPGLTLYTTASDYAVFLVALINETGLNKETFAEMFRPQIHANPDRVGDKWGLGIGVNQNEQGDSLWHWGDNGDFKCYFEIFKEEKIGAVFFVNSNNGHAITEHVMFHAIGEKSPVIKAFGYPRLNSPVIKLTYTFKTSGVEETAKLFSELFHDLSSRLNSAERTILGLGQQAIDDKNISGAEKIFKAVIEADPESVPAYVSLSEVYFEQGDVEKARETCQKALTFDPDSESAKYIMARIEPFEIDMGSLKPIYGEYLRSTGNSRVWQEDGKLYVSSAGVMEMYPVSEDTFLARWGTTIYRITFVKGEDGKVKEYVLVIDGKPYGIRKKVK
jgi:CubicO group peptidase (beta-lactamase class C family)